jgi:tetratricopeptide (TPR) repeat protein
MAIKGSLKEASLADVCQLLSLGQKRGCLSIADRLRFGQIYFDHGRITYSRIVNRRDRLGDLLLNAGVITAEQLAGALEEQTADPDCKLGEVLVKQGMITRAELEKFIRLQIEEAILHLFTWSRGNFYFEADQLPEGADILVSINPDSLLLEAARRIDEWSLIEKKIPTLDLIFQVDEARVKQALSDLTPEQARIIALLDGTRALDELADQTGISEFEVGKAVYGLIQAGLAARVGRREEVAKRGPEAEKMERRNLGIAFYRTAMLEDARREFERLRELDPADLQARLHLALIALREHQYRDALRQLKSIIEETGPHFGVFVNLAFALRALGRPLDALLVLSEAEAMRPATPTVALARAVALTEAEQFDDAATAFTIYIQRLAGSQRPAPAYYYFAALAAAVSKRPTEAEALITEGLAEHPDSPLLLLMAGLLAERGGAYPMAEKWYRGVIEADPTLVQGHKNLGDVFYRRGLHEEAARHYRRALALSPKLGDDTLAKLANIHYSKGEHDEAVGLWHHALELNPGNQVVRNNLETALDAT